MMWGFTILIWSLDQQMKLSVFLTRRKRQYGYVARMDETRIATQPTILFVKPVWEVHVEDRTILK